MAMDRFDDLEAFLAIVDLGSQTAAARRLGRSLQAVGRSLAALEASVGVELVRRTTRRSGPTEAGLAFYRRLKPAMTEIAAARLEAANRRDEPAGRLRIAAPVLFAPAHVVPAAAELMAHHPALEIELRVSDRPLDLVEEGIDVAVRIRELPDSALKARKVGELRLVVVGAPGYFARHGRPRHPDELADHQCVLRTADGEGASWPFRVGGRRRTVAVRGRFRTDGTAAIHAAVAEGLGLGFTPLWQIRDLVDRGAVEIVLAEYEADRLPVHAVWPSSKLVPAATRAFVDLLAARLKHARL
jgi:DNA-binding transcriptional LysR family regulator